MDEQTSTLSLAWPARSPAPHRPRASDALAGPGRRIPHRLARAILLLALAAACGPGPEAEPRVAPAARTRLLHLGAGARAADVPPGAGSCEDPAAMPASPAPASAKLGEPTAFAVVASDVWGKVRKPVRCVLTTREEWLALRGWAGVDRDSAAYPGPPAGAVLVVASLGERRTAGERLAIDSVWRSGDTITVGVHRVGTGLGQALTYPIVVVEVPTSSRHVRFLEQ